MKYLPNSVFEGEAWEVLLPSQAHFTMCLVKRGLILKVNILQIVNRNCGNVNECEEHWPQRSTDFHFGTTFTDEVELS